MRHSLSYSSLLCLLLLLLTVSSRCVLLHWWSCWFVCDLFGRASPSASNCCRYRLRDVKLFERKVARRLPLFRADSVDIQKSRSKKIKNKNKNKNHSFRITCNNSATSPLESGECDIKAIIIIRLRLSLICQRHI